MFVWCAVVFYCVSVVRDCVCMVLDGAIMCYMVFLCSVLCYRAILCFIILSCVLGAKNTHTHTRGKFVCTAEDFFVALQPRVNEPSHITTMSTP